MELERGSIEQEVLASGTQIDLSDLRKCLLLPSLSPTLLPPNTYRLHVYVIEPHVPQL